jgi:predicted nuclease of restriction endonuclease-like (RecB) superfamily
MDFTNLVKAIADIHNSTRGAAAASVNHFLTVRNWLFGMYIIEYEQQGSDRADYGSTLLERLSYNLLKKEVKGVSVAALRNYRQFYNAYPQLSRIISRDALMLSQLQIQQKPSVEFHNHIDNKSVNDISPPPENLIKHFSFSHFVELMRITDPLKRAFYEIEGINGCWSVPQLKRQIESQLYERTGLSIDKVGLIKSVHAQGQVTTIDEMIRNPYILEFTGLPERYQYSESDLESALLNHIQSFLLELGNGFCFEARQKRITLDNEHDRIDLVFFHRILRCHLLIDLKVRKFQHGDAGQMNFYLNYYRENIMSDGDNPPVGLILCTDRDSTRVKYAISGMDNQLFVSKYLTALPSEEKIREFLETDRNRTENILKEHGPEYRP